MYFYCFWLKHSLKGDLTSNIMHNASIQADKGLQKKLGKCNVVSSAPQSLHL